MHQIGSELRQTEILSDSEFRLFKDLIYSECGVSIGTEKRTFLESRLRRRMDDLGIRSGYEYYCLVKHSQGRSQELPSLLDTLMICETAFFRNQPQFDLLSQVVLPEIIEKKEQAGTRLIRVWSAGCSTGQEPYSAVIAMLESLPDAESWTLRVFASDLSFTALERAQCGLYREDQLKGIEAGCISKYFRRENGHYAVSDAVKRRVIFDYHNLKHDNGLRGLDMVFCRNVMIYFDRPTRAKIVNEFRRILRPAGYLFMGHSESLTGMADGFKTIDVSIYRKE